MAKWVAVWRFIGHQSVRLSIAAVGFVVLAAGVVMLVTPGPGLVVIVAGLAILAREFSWAERALDQARARAVRAKDATLRRASGRRRPEPNRSTQMPGDSAVEP